jgi:NRPS condensation-like uncharacterized protein
LLNGPVSPHRVFDGTVFELGKIREIKDRIEGATVNDVVLTIIGGGLRHYLQSRDGLPDVSLSVMAPISVRAEGEKGAMGNLVSAMVVRVGTQIADAGGVGRLGSPALHPLSHFQYARSRL